MKKLLVVFLFSATTVLVGCADNSLAKSITGSWKVPLTYQEEDSSIALNCKSEYFPTKAILTECDANIIYPENNVKIIAKLKLTGDWEVKDKILYQKVVDSITNVEKIIVAGTDITDSDEGKEAQRNMNEIFSKMFAKGETTKTKTLMITSEKWVFEEEVDGKTMAMTATRP